MRDVRRPKAWVKVPRRGNAMIGRPATDSERAKLERINSTRISLVVLMLLCSSSVIILHYAIPDRYETLKVFLAIALAVVVLGMLIYLSFCLRCPRCSGWIAIPKCPACGLRLEKR